MLDKQSAKCFGIKFKDFAGKPLLIYGSEHFNILNSKEKEDSYCNFEVLTYELQPGESICSIRGWVKVHSSYKKYLILYEPEFLIMKTGGCIEETWFDFKHHADAFRQWKTKDN